VPNVLPGWLLKDRLSFIAALVSIHISQAYTAIAAMSAGSNYPPDRERGTELRTARVELVAEQRCR
jgi:hypothetical protein